MSEMDWAIIVLVIAAVCIVGYAGWRIVQAGDDD